MSALMTGHLKQRGFRAAGAAALIPSFAREGSGSSSRSFKAIYPGHAARNQIPPQEGAEATFHTRIMYFNLDIKDISRSDFSGK